MVKFETISGSLYEVDYEKSLVRRLIGIENPTPSQGKDGEWKKYDIISKPLEVGKSVIFVWAIELDDMDEECNATAKTTMTSAIKQIITPDTEN